VTYKADNKFAQPKQQAKLLLSNQKMGFVSQLTVTDQYVLARRIKPKTAGGIALRPRIRTPKKFSPESSHGGMTTVQNLMYLKSANAHEFIHRAAKLKASEAINHLLQSKPAGFSTPVQRSNSHF
jgi:hypothetical protein